VTLTDALRGSGTAEDCDTIRAFARAYPWADYYFGAVVDPEEAADDVADIEAEDESDPAMVALLRAELVASARKARP